MRTTLNVHSVDHAFAVPPEPAAYVARPGPLVHRPDNDGLSALSSGVASASYSSYDSGRAITFPLGKGRVIKGWDEGIAKMHTGDQAIFIIPPKIGYGEKGNGPIPPNASMIFIVELMDINPK